MEPKDSVISFDFSSLYPTMMKVYDFEKPKFRREKIERLIQKMNDKRIDQKLPS